MTTEAQYEDVLERIDELDDLGKRDEAQALCADALAQAEKAGDGPYIHAFRGALAYLRGDYEAYRREAAEALRLSPESPMLNREMGVALGLDARHEEALEYLSKALALRPDYPRALGQLAALLVSLSRFGEALDAIERALAQEPDNHVDLATRADVLAKLGRRDQAFASVERALAAEPASVYARWTKAEILSRSGDTDGALEWFAKAESLRPGDAALLRDWGVCLSNSGRLDEAMAKLEAALAASPGEFGVRLSHTIVMGLSGLEATAAKELQQLLRDRPDSEQAKLWLFRFAEPRRAGELERKRLEERQREERERWELAIRLDAWRKLSGRTAHRVDNQLFAAKGALRTLKEHASPETSEEIRDIEASLDRVGRICMEFRRFSTEQPPKARATDVRLLIHDAVSRLRKSAEGMELEEDLPPLMPECQWDPQQIEQAITELLENAIRHTPKGKKIAVEAQPLERNGKQGVRIAVQNEGQGIEGKYKERLFEPFFSLRPGGTGLGLAIVKQIIDNHKGGIRETGEPGKFARFEIELPARPFEEEAHEDPGD